MTNILNITEFLPQNLQQSRNKNFIGYTSLWRKNKGSVNLYPDRR